MIIVLARTSGTARAGSTRSALDRGRLPADGPAVALVMLQPDLGTSLVLVAILAGMLFMSGASLRWLLAMAIAALAAIPIAWTYVLRDYQKDRILSFLNPTADAQGSGWQVLQSQMTVGSGGLLGTGLTNGAPGPRRVPAGPGERLRVRRCSRRSSGSSAPIVVFVLFMAPAVAHPRLRLALA